MINNVATGWMALFRQMRSPTGFLQSFFRMRPGNAYNGSKVQVEVVRNGERLAIPVKRGTGPNMNDASLSTVKEFTPPAYNEGFPADVEELVERMEGNDPYTDANTSYAAKLMAKLMSYFRLGTDMIGRGVELQAAQILQTGKLSLTDAAANVRYELDFLPKATHFPTVGTGWGAAGSTKLQDLQDLAKVIRADGKVNPDTLIFGARALDRFLSDDDVQKKLDNVRIDIGQVRPRQAMGGATFYGFVWVGAYRMEMWTYPEGYDAPAGSWTEYVDTDKVVMLSSSTRFDRTSARVPLPLGPDPRVASLMPGRLTDAGMDMDVTPNLYCTPNGKQLMAEIESRVLLVPAQIDGFGCVLTQP